MRVSELAQAAGLTADAVRHYARIGLLVPRKDAANGYRRFGAADLDRLRFVRQARALGFRLDEITRILHRAEEGEPPCAEVRATVRARLGEVRAQIAELRSREARLRSALLLWADMPDGVTDEHETCALIEAAGELRRLDA